MHGPASLIAPFFNVTVLVGVLVYFLRKPISDFVSSRHAGLRDEVQRVSEQLRQSQSQFEEFSAKLKAIHAEISALREQAKQDAEATRARVVNDAKKLSAVILSDAKSSADAAFGDLKTQLRTELANRVLERAEALLRERLTSDERVRIRREFSSQLEKVQ